jgi:signal transduction histidine kinase
MKPCLPSRPHAPLWPVLLLLAICPPVAAQPASPSLTTYGLSPALTIIGPPAFRIDEESRPDLQQVEQAPFPLSYDSFTRQLSRNPRPYTFWIRCALSNGSDSALGISIYCGDLNYIDAWWVSPDQPARQISGGTLRPPFTGSSVIDRQYHILPMTIQPHQTGQLFLSLRQKTQVYDFNGVHLYSATGLGKAFAQDYEEGYVSMVFEWLFQGFLLCQILYILFQWLIIRRKDHLYYLAYIAVVALYFLSKFETDLGVNGLFTRFPSLKVYLNKTLLILPYFLYFRFIRSFLEIPQQYPALNKWIIRVENFLLVYLVVDEIYILATFDSRLQTEIFTAVLLVIFLLAASFIIYLFRRRQALIYYVLTGSLLAAIGNITGLVITYFQDYHHLHIVNNIMVFPQTGVLLEMLCFTAGLGYKSHRWEKEKIRSQERLIEQLQANELLQARMQHIRNKIAQDLHDDIGSTLSSISILSDLAIRGNSNTQTLETMNEIKDSSMMLMEQMDDIVWSINPRNDSLDHLLMRIRHFATTLFEARGIDYSIDIQKNINEVRLPMDYRQHIYLILKETINNLVKYADASEAVIEVRFDHRHLLLSVRDNGRGFESAASSTGNGLAGMRQRAALMNARVDIASAPGSGTAIRLEVDLT